MEMKNRNKKLLIICLICISLVLIACLVGLILHLSSENDDRVEFTEAKNTVMEFLEAYKAKQPNAIKYLEYSVNEKNISYDGFQGILSQQIEYTVGEITRQEDQIVVAVEITNIDLKKVFNEVINQLPSDATQETILKQLQLKMEDKDCDKKIFECDVLVVDDGGYKIIMTDKLSNALLGGYNEYLKELTTSQEDNND